MQLSEASPVQLKQVLKLNCTAMLSANRSIMKQAIIIIIFQKYFPFYFSHISIVPLFPSFFQEISPQWLNPTGHSKVMNHRCTHEFTENTCGNYNCAGSLRMYFACSICKIYFLLFTSHLHNCNESLDNSYSLLWAHVTVCVQQR